MIFVAEDFRRFISPCLTPAAMTQRLSSRKFFPFQNSSGPIVQIIFVLRMVPPGTVEILPFLLRNWNKKFTLVCKVKYFPLFFIVYKRADIIKPFHSFGSFFMNFHDKRVHTAFLILTSFLILISYRIISNIIAQNAEAGRIGQEQVAVAATSPI